MASITIKYEGVELECSYVIEGLKGLHPRDPDAYTFYVEQVFHGGEDVTPLLDDGILETIERMAEQKVNINENQADCFA